MPGVYIFEDKNHGPLYIGKSISLKTRIRQHFEGFEKGTTKAANFIPQTKTLYLKIVQNDIEAIITEANYIKSYKPRYNSITKDDKSNVYIVFTNSPDTKIKVIHATDIQTLGLDDYQKQIFGPYTSSATAQILVKLIRNIFGFCLSPFNARDKACFNYHIGHCPGVCMSLVTPENYQRHLGRAKKFLSGKFLALDKFLNREIVRSIKKQDFEKAELLKRQIEGLHQTLNTRNSSLLLKLSDSTDSLQHRIVTTLNHPILKTAPMRIECYDLAHLQGENYVGSMSVFIRGQASTADYRHFNIESTDKSDPFAMRQIIRRRFNHPEWGKPDLIVLDGGKPQLSIVTPEIPSDIPVIALAKKQETIMFYDENQKVVSINLPLEDPVLNLFRSVRDEAHRFANSFYRRKREKSLIG